MIKQGLRVKDTSIPVLGITFKEYGSPEPVFENFQHGFRVMVYALHGIVAEKVGEKLTNNQLKIIESISENPYIAAPELSVIVGISKRKDRSKFTKT